MLGGTIRDYDYIRTLFKPDDLVVCADGGLRHLDAMGIAPHIWIGDGDSCTLCDEDFCRLTKDANVVKLNPVKDATDGEAVYDRCIELDVSSVLVVGFSGTRADHTLANIFMMKIFFQKGIDALAVNENNKIFFAKKDNYIKKEDYSYISLMPVSFTVSGVSTSGLAYPLKNATLSKFSSFSVSNEFEAESCHIHIDEGDALIILSKD